MTAPPTHALSAGIPRCSQASVVPPPGAPGYPASGQRPRCCDGQRVWYQPLRRLTRLPRCSPRPADLLETAARPAGEGITASGPASAMALLTGPDRKDMTDELHRPHLPRGRGRWTPAPRPRQDVAASPHPPRLSRSRIGRAGHGNGPDPGDAGRRQHGEHQHRRPRRRSRQRAPMPCPCAPCQPGR